MLPSRPVASSTPTGQDSAKQPHPDIGMARATCAWEDGPLTQQLNNGG